MSVLVSTEWRVLWMWMEETFRLWNVAANTLNKESRTADKVCSSSLGVGRGANNFSRRKIILFGNVTQGIEIWRVVKKDLGNMCMAQDSDWWQAVVNSVMNLRIPWKAGNFLSVWGTLSFSKRALLRGIKSIPRALTEHRTMKAYWGSGGIAPLILWPRH